MLHTYRYRILRAMCVRACSVRSFTEGAITLALPARHAEAYIADLLEDGLIEPYGADTYVATNAGVALATAPTTVAGTRSHTSMGQPPFVPRSHTSMGQPPFVPPKWVTCRPGADDHKRHLSHGVGA